MAMDYSRVKDWILAEDSFNPDQLGKCEAIMSLGNGYLGLRSATEEKYLGETRDLLVNGTFNKFDPTSVTELPNAADMVGMEFRLDGERFNLDKGTVKSYIRELNIRTAQLRRAVEWISPKGIEIAFESRRVVSLESLHDFAQRITLRAVSGDVTLKMTSGIDGQVTNTGAQHFTDGDKRFYDGGCMQYVPATTESGITFVQNTAHSFYVDGEPLDIPMQVNMDLRKLYGVFSLTLKKGQTLTVEKYCNVYTTRDYDMQGKTVAEIQQLSLEALRAFRADGFDKLAADTAEAWERQVWSEIPIVIEGSDMDQFAIRFAQYHLRLMVPAHDNRMNIGAKGLSGEGYRGHCFWDTEIFLLPYYIFTQRETARKLEEYRYLSLPGAHKKAAHNGYKGAMFPWESAWLDDGEVTPEYQGVDIVTGLPIKVWSGFIEQHITADVAFGVWQYYTITGDQEYMDRYGYELIFDTARFWISRLEENNRQIHESVGEDGHTVFSETVTNDGYYHICDVVGPDEYKEHKTDNAFTNYLAVWNIRKAIEYYDLLKAEKPELWAALNEKLSLDAFYAEWTAKVDKIFLPLPREDGVLPQDSTYLTLQDIDLEKYKKQDFVNGIFRDYNLTQINQIQVSKQADVLVLFFLLEDLFPAEVKKATWAYYAARTLHDSSLSLCTHAVLAADMKEQDMAYDLFVKSTQIDLGPVMTTSNAGIHTASFGGIWQGVVYGFGGLRMLGGKLRIEPMLPKKWTSLSYTLWWKGQKLSVLVTKENVTVTNLTAAGPVQLTLCGKEYTFTDSVTAAL